MKGTQKDDTARLCIIIYAIISQKSLNCETYLLCLRLIWLVQIYLYGSAFAFYFPLGLGDMAQKIITIIIFISVDIDNYHDKCQIFISFKFKARFLLQSESFRNQTINFP